MRKLPETGLQFIREFKKEESALEGFFRFVGFEFAPNDKAFHSHAAETTARVHLDKQDRDLGADGKLPSGGEAHAALGDIKVSVGADLGICTIVQIEGRAGLGCQHCVLSSITSKQWRRSLKLGAH